MKGRYEAKKEIGNGPYGIVYMVENERGEVFAMKEIDKIALTDYKIKAQKIHDVIQTMEILNQTESPHIVKFIDYEETEGTIRIVSEYCDQGDLFMLQSQKPKKVFTLDEAIEILKDVIYGINSIHFFGCIHKNIKPQNILIKTEGRKKVYKVADFGIVKKSQRNAALGSSYFMSPEIYSGKEYGCEVDMWAFGVMFFFMLNKEYPFRKRQNVGFIEIINQSEDLIEQARNFSYKKFVQNTKLKNMDTCTVDMEDLFSKIFETNPSKRINFSEIIAHRVFKGQFIDNVMFHTRADQVQKCYTAERELIEKKNYQIEFLYEISKRFLKSKDLLKMIQMSALEFNILKYYFFLKKSFISDLKSRQFFIRFSTKKMFQFSKSKEYEKLLQKYQKQLLKAYQKFTFLEDFCGTSIKELSAINTNFNEIFNLEVGKQFIDPFKSSFVEITIAIYLKLKQQEEYFYELLAAICYSYEHIFVLHTDHEYLFFPKNVENQEEGINYELYYAKLLERLEKQSPAQLKGITKKIIGKYFE